LTKVKSLRDQPRDYLQALFGSRGTTSGNRSGQDCPFNLYVADLTGNHSGAETTQTNEPSVNSRFLDCMLRSAFSRVCSATTPASLGLALDGDFKTSGISEQFTADNNFSSSFIKKKKNFSSSTSITVAQRKFKYPT